ncbi:sensor histidine kinase [Croceicoccus naphthovorans]|uniref:histidine kinase n=1 Tax=Croceicoccus naphthovorans TaxID=1348774 RepID=A0A0G3XGV1_9SPHN|nr:PAS domain S-box protein [Croceicoccus naphthovorans]AKM09573.1 histidine kinase [Croceicoccus naphthovorans]MBB3989660.1 PAS domain S-box-containing protein [Croceicoccus naphthovorans]
MSKISSEALLAAVVENSDDAIVSKTLDGVVMSWNRGAERLFGWTADEMIGQSIRKLIPDDRQAEEDAIIRQIVAGRQVSSMHSVRVRKTGAPVRVSVTISPIRGADGTIIGASKIARDVGALEHARQQLAESERRFKTLADNISQLAWIADKEGWIFWYNQRWFEYTGTTLKDMEGWGWKAVHHPDHVDRVVERVQRSWDTGELWEDTFPLRGKDGTYRWFLSRARPIHDENGEIFCWFGTNTDVTEQRVQAESIQTLLQEVNHRSKNMLTLIQSLARRSAPGNDEFLKRFVRRLEALAANQDLLVRRAWTVVDLRELVEAQLSFAIGIAGSNLEFDGPDVEIGSRAAETLGMALHELATNALKYGALSAEGGTVRIEWSVAEDRFAIDWHETGGPAVEEPTRVGFGTSVIRDIPRTALDADTTLDFAPDGLRWHFAAPMKAVAGKSV